MRVEKPRFDELGEVRCDECPLDDNEQLCQSWLAKTSSAFCPDSMTYAEACRLAEQAEKGEK